jgi:tetratricopeptide (TPR) repeat protein
MDDPNNASVLYALGKLCENMNDRAKALKYYLDAVSADPSDKEFKAAAQKLQK